MKYLSLFSGIGGFELGIQQAYEKRYLGIESADKESKQAESQIFKRGVGSTMEEEHSILSSDQRRERPVHCVGFSEIDKYAISIYQKHFPEHKNWGDITKINENELPDFEFLCGGFPCQSFSIAGKRGGFNDTRGTMFFHIARILKAKRPRLLLLENVKGLLSHDQGKTFATIISTLDELGYDLQWQVLNSKSFGVPQNRERVFIVGHLRGTSRPKVFPIGEGEGESARETDEQGCTNTLTGRSAGGQNRRGNYIADVSMMGREGHPREYFKTAPTVTSRTYKEPPVVMPQIRRLTPTECERLQGFPDGWTELGVDGKTISDSQRYKTLGNAVTTNVIKAIMEKLI